MTHGPELTVKERRSRDRRVFRIALGVSLILHLLVFTLWKTVPLPPSPFAAAGPRAGDNRAASGSMQAMNLAVPQSRTITPPRVPLISIEDVEPVEINMEEPVDLESLTGGPVGEASDQGPGIEGGEGRGDGGTAEEGLFRMVPPSPRGMIVPPTNDVLKGKSMEVWVFVDAFGRVVPDSTRLNPPTSDRGFNRRVREEASEWVFNPAQKGGEPVAAWFPYTISM